MDDFFDDLQQTPQASSVVSDGQKFDNDNPSSQEQSQGAVNDFNSVESQSKLGTSDATKRAEAKVKDVAAIKSMLSEMGVSHYEPEVVDGLLEFAYKYMHSVLEDSKLYSKHANKSEIDVSDVKLALQLRAGQDVVQPVPREMMMEIAKKKNAVPLPQVKPGVGLRLPTDRYCLTQPNYKMKSSSAVLRESMKPYSRKQPLQMSNTGGVDHPMRYQPMAFQSINKLQQHASTTQRQQIPHNSSTYHPNTMTSRQSQQNVQGNHQNGGAAFISPTAAHSQISSNSFIR